MTSILRLQWFVKRKQTNKIHKHKHTHTAKSPKIPNGLTFSTWLISNHTMYLRSYLHILHSNNTHPTTHPPTCTHTTHVAAWRKPMELDCISSTHKQQNLTIFLSTERWPYQRWRWAVLFNLSSYSFHICIFDSDNSTVSIVRTPHVSIKIILSCVKLTIDMHLISWEWKWKK